MPRDGELRLNPRVTMVPVTSSNVGGIGYDHAARRLYVQFLGHTAGMAGSLYEYDEVPVEEFEGLLEVNRMVPLTRCSVGQAFNERIKKGGFEYRRLG